MRQVVAWTEIESYARGLLESRTLKPGDRFPSSAELRERFGVGEQTITKALAPLVADGLIQHRGRSGTVVADRPIEVLLDWESIRNTVAAMHGEIESEFAPDVVLTMSGPGGFAALLSLSLNPRLVPVLSSVTFPRREKRSRAEADYRKAAKSSTTHFETGKWSIYLPKALFKYPDTSRVVIFDDRLISGTTQSMARDLLEANGYQVRTAAMVVSTDNVMKLDYYGLIIDDSFRMPWGTDRGRT